MKRPVFVLEKLKNAGYEAYFVGGCVRDTLLGREVHDWDMTTSATPEETMTVFSKCVPTGLKHGTVTVLEQGEMFEVTTFRCDGEYLDGRRPENVTFVRDLKEDLSRRDFTVNAMAMDADGNITDLFEGREDLQNKIIRCVGDAETRFREDALRMLRALRFSAQLGFSIEGRTYAAIRRCAVLSSALSAERVRDEVEKTLLSPDPGAVTEMIRLGLLSAFGLSGSPDLTALEQLPAEKTIRWAAFFRACRSANWEDFRLDKKTGQTAQSSAMLSGSAKTELQWKRLISRHGADTARCTAALDGAEETVNQLLDCGDCLFLSDLAVSGKDFPGLQGREVGNTLHRLLEHVLEHPEDNQKETLLVLAEKL